MADAYIYDHLRTPRGADRVVLMRHGVLREQGPAAQIFSAPVDAYTRARAVVRLS